MHVPGGDVGERAAALVLVLDSHRAARPGRGCRMAGDPSLDRRLLVGGDHEVVSAQRLPLKFAAVQIEDAACLGREVRVARKDPAAVGPGLDRVLAQPSPDGRARDAGYEASAQDLALDIRQWRRENGRPRLLASSHAIALTATTSGGKNWAATRTWALFKTWQAFFEEAPAPLRDDLAWQGEALPDRLVLQAGSSHENDLGPHAVAAR